MKNSDDRKKIYIFFANFFHNPAKKYGIKILGNRDKRAASTTTAGHAPRDAGQQKEKGGTVTNCYTLYAWRHTADGRGERQHAHRTPVATP